MRIKIIITFGLIISFIVIGLIVCFRVTPISLKQEEVHSIHIGIELSSKEKSISGSADIKDYDKIIDSIKILNSIKAYSGKYLDLERSGDSPSAWIDIYNEKGETIDYIAFYDNILTCRAGNFIIFNAEYDKLSSLCKKYGEFWSE